MNAPELTNDPIVKGMAEEYQDMPMRAFYALLYSDGSPRLEFMNEAGREYKARSGKAEPSLGAVADAILALIKEETQ